MKRMLLAPVLSALCTLATAQITITNATFPAAGDSLVYCVDNAPLGLTPFTTPGIAQTWDFSTLQKEDTLSVVYSPAALGIHAADYPGADLVILGQAGETYFNVTNTKFEALGYAGADPAGLGLNVVTKFSPPVYERYAPMNFFDIKSQSSFIGVAFSTDQPPLDSIFANLPVNVDSLRVRINTERLQVVDAWGTVAIPGGSYPVLREKRTDYTTTGMDLYVVIFGFGTWVDAGTVLGGGGGLGLGTDTTVTYHFFSDTEKEEIAMATMSNDLSTVESIRFKNNATVPTIEPVSAFTGGIQAFPNPAVEWVRFDCVNLTPGDYTLKIFNIIGKCVWKKNYTLSGTTSFRVELDDFKKGTYIYSLVDKQGNSVGTKRLVVLKP
ncbi:MAG: T9SS type A sorting domain-containing protein [Phycisphaerae bacterium]|nr:T9SS type A sorting domain-containing protein [Saprospiraceae bacterium]